jgi:hypothetical protein
VPAVERGYARRVPALRWPGVALAALVLALAATGAWEMSMRHAGLHAGDLDDGDGHWVVERRKVDTGPRDSIVLVGDSRILFDTNLDEWQRLTGRRPIQLALEGTNGAPFLEDLANDEHFAGLVVVGMAPSSYFRERVGLHDKALRHLHDESPSQRVGHLLDLQLQEVLAFLDHDYALFPLIERHHYPERAGFDADNTPYYDVWKLRETAPDRQYRMWPRIVSDPYLQEHARMAWHDFDGKVIEDADIAKVIAKTKGWVARIRARGGEVVFVRPPSSGRVIGNEDRRVARERSWDPLLAATGSYGFHFRDDPVSATMQCPEWSHLTADDATVFTRIYVGALKAHVPWLEAHASGGVPHERPDRG